MKWIQKILGTDKIIEKLDEIETEQTNIRTEVEKITETIEYNPYGHQEAKKRIRTS